MGLQPTGSGIMLASRSSREVEVGWIALLPSTWTSDAGPAVCSDGKFTLTALMSRYPGSKHMLSFKLDKSGHSKTQYAICALLGVTGLYALTVPEHL